MSQWHRDHPELVGTDADPWMSNPGHRRAYESLVREGHIDPPDEDDEDLTLDEITPTRIEDRPMPDLRPKQNDHPWFSITVVTIRAGQPRAYADHHNEYEVTFTGGSPSSFPDQELPFATMPPFNRALHEDTPTRTTVRFPPKTIDELEAEHYERLKARIRPMIGWSTDSTKGEPRAMGGTWLETFQHIRGDAFSNTYRVVTKTPFMD